MRNILAICLGAALMLVACMPASEGATLQSTPSGSDTGAYRSSVTTNASNSSGQQLNDDSLSQASRTEETPKFPPEVWIKIDSATIQGTVGSFNVAEAPPPELMDNVASVTLVSATKPELIIQESRIREVHAFLRPWGDYEAQPARIKVSQKDTAPGHYSIGPIMASSDTALIVNVFFDESTGGFDATYVWRLRRH